MALQLGPHHSGLALTKGYQHQAYHLRYGEAVFRGYQTHNPWYLKPIAANLLHRGMGRPSVRFDAPAWLEVVLSVRPS